jgi:flagellar P-ring protein FlgI
MTRRASIPAVIAGVLLVLAMFATAVLVVVLVGAALIGSSQAAQAETRVKDITTIEGLRANQLIGYGLVVGLPGTGDTLRNAPFTDQAIKSMLEHLGVNVRRSEIRANNAAAVIVTAELPAFIQPGGRIDVTVSALGDATSLRGGTLLMTALLGGDGEAYAAAQGALIVSAVTAAGDAETVEQGVATVGRVPGGGMVERAAPGALDATRTFALELSNPDFSTAMRVAEAVNGVSRALWGREVARAESHRRVTLAAPDPIAPAAFLAAIGDASLTVDAPARVVVDERTGTVVIGADVRLSRVAITHGAISIRVTETPMIVQPNPFAGGDTATQPLTDIVVGEAGDQVAIVEGADLETLVAGLNQLGVRPQGIIAVLQAVKSAGALQGELIVQ